MSPIAFAFALLLAGPAAAADWKEYVYPDLSFTVHFPLDPKVEFTTFHAPEGRSLETRVYLASHETGSFKVTIAEVPHGAGEENALVSHAIKTMTEGGTVKFETRHRIRQVFGRQLAIAGANGGYSYVAVFYHKKRLYQIEGHAFVAGGQAEVDAMRFQQSLDFT